MLEMLELAPQKVKFATSQNAFGNGVPMFDTLAEALPAIGIAALLAAAAAAAVGGYFVYRWMKHRRAIDMTDSTTRHFFFFFACSIPRRPFKRSLEKR